MKVFIDGREGTTGLRIEERLGGRSDVTLLTIAADKRKDAAARKELINASDLVFLCLPDDAAREAVAMIENPNVRVIDASTAHRTLPDWTYGFAELGYRASLVESKRVAVPGCHASGFLAIVAPLTQHALIDPSQTIVCHSLTGYSGGGKKMIASYEAGEPSLAPRAYGLSQTHKHLKEMKAIAHLASEPIFCPIVSSYYSGMAVTVPLTAAQLKVGSIAALTTFYRDYYAGEPFISIKGNADAPTGFLAADELSGYDSMELYVLGNDERMTVTAVFDNLGKGASGAAVQCMNAMFSLGEDTGLKLLRR